MKTNTYFDYLYLFWELSNINDAKRYLTNIQKNFSKLDKIDKEKYIKILQSFFLEGNENKLFINQKYYVYRSKKAIRYLLSSVFIHLNTQNFDTTINELLELTKTIEEKQPTSVIKTKDFNIIFETIIKKMPNFNNILDKITLDILIFNNTDKFVNSLTIPSNNFNSYQIICFYMKNNEEYKYGILNPIYVFLHELGHVICWLATKNLSKVPNSFFKEIGKYMNDLDPNSPEALEVFADSFAMAIMYNTELNKYNPFKCLSEVLFIDLEKYYKELIKKL